MGFIFLLRPIVPWWGRERQWFVIVYRDNWSFDGRKNIVVDSQVLFILHNSRRRREMVLMKLKGDFQSHEILFVSIE